MAFTSRILILALSLALPAAGRMSARLSNAEVKPEDLFTDVFQPGKE